jgi:drug/metabolite transporter (DMT)-like permease
VTNQTAWAGIVLFTLLFSVATAASTTLLGDRTLLSGSMFSAAWAVRILLHWKFWLAMALAVLARFSFVGVNHFALKIPALAPAATTVTAFITCVAFLFLILANVFFLDEQLTLRQVAGSLTILAGIAVIMG